MTEESTSTMHGTKDPIFFTIDEFMMPTSQRPSGLVEKLVPERRELPKPDRLPG